MKNILFWALIVFAGDLYAGAVGGGGSSGLMKQVELMSVYSGANNLSKATFGIENQFKLDFQNKVVVFDADQKNLDRSETLSFEEVSKFADPAPAENQ